MDIICNTHKGLTNHSHGTCEPVLTGIIGEQERANLVVRTAEFSVYMYLSDGLCTYCNTYAASNFPNVSSILHSTAHPPRVHIHVFTLTQREAYASKREVGETVLFTRDTPGVVLSLTVRELDPCRGKNMLCY